MTDLFRPIADVATGEPPPPLDYGLLIPDGHVLLYGFGEAGKGVVAAWCAAQDTLRGLVVLILDYENNPDEWRARIERFGGDLSRVYIALPAPEGELSGPVWEQAEDIAEWAERLDAGRLVVDSVVYATQVDEASIGAPNLPVLYRQALDVIGVSSLSIGHASGSLRRESLAKPWGSHFWRNAFRMLWSAWLDKPSRRLELVMTKKNRYRERSYVVDWSWAWQLGDGETPSALVLDEAREVLAAERDAEVDGWLAVIGDEGATKDELQTAWKLADKATRNRISQLRAMGLIRHVQESRGARRYFKQWPPQITYVSGQEGDE